MNQETNPFRFFLFDALKFYSEDVHIVGQSNPIGVRLNGVQYSVHVSEVHFANRNNQDEYRIQLTPEELEVHRSNLANNAQPVFLGLFSSARVFVAWEPEYVLSMQAQHRFSIYCRNSQERTALRSGASVYLSTSHVMGRQIQTIALPVQALGFYIENIERFHRVQSETLVRLLIAQTAHDLAGPVADRQGQFELRQDGESREQFIFMRRAFPRDPAFKDQVLAAYERACCVCDRQLGIVQAAHIIPHSVPDSPNCVSNGLALCVEHHELYDTALLLPGPGQRLVFNEDRAEYLRRTSQDKGLDAIAEQNGLEFYVPSTPNHQPNDDYLQRGLQIRMGQYS